MNGMAVGDFVRPYGGTFFTFSDYMRPAIRLAALSKYPSIFVFTHDSIGLGEDGPTHQAVEHLSSLRAMPGLITLRPADANETAYAWKFALEYRDGPVALALSRQKLPVLDQSKYVSARHLYRGGYILITGEHPDVILLSSGSEVHLALKAYERLLSEGISARVVSMPSWELFDAQSDAYHQWVLPRGIRARIAVEAGVRHGWERYIGDRGTFIGMDSFGASAPAEAVFAGFGITADRVYEAAQELLS
jgi:transketolase